MGVVVEVLSVRVEGEWIRGKKMVRTRETKGIMKYTHMHTRSDETKVPRVSNKKPKRQARHDRRVSDR